MWRQRRLEKQQSHYEKVDRPQRGPPLVRLEKVSYFIFFVVFWLLLFCFFIYFLFSI